MITFLHLRFSNIRVIIVVVFTNITKIVLYENEISRLKIAIFAFISLNAENRRRNDELKQCLSRAIIAVLFVNKNLYKNNIEFILNLIKTLKKKRFCTNMSQKHHHVEQTSTREVFCSDYILNNKFLKSRDCYYVFDEKSLRTKLLKRHHDNILINHFVDITV